MKKPVLLILTASVLFSGCSSAIKPSDQSEFLWELGAGTNAVQSYHSNGCILISDTDHTEYIDSFEIKTAENENIKISIENRIVDFELITNENGKIIGQSGTITDEAGVTYKNSSYHIFGDVSSDNLFVTSNMAEAPQIYALDTALNELRPLISDKAYGYSKEDYQKLCTKYDAVYWCNDALFNSDYSKILYCSNKYEQNSSPALEPGIWIYDVKSGSEERINTSADETVIMSDYCWYDDSNIIYQTYSATDLYCYMYDTLTKKSERIYEWSSDVPWRYFDGYIMTMGENITIYSIKSDKTISFPSSDYVIDSPVGSDETVAFINPNTSDAKPLVLVDIKTEKISEYSLPDKISYPLINEINDDKVLICGTNIQGEIISIYAKDVGN